MRHAVRLDGVGIVFVVFLLLLLLLFHMGFQRAASDGRAYFVQVRSLVMDWDLDFANDEAMFGDQAQGYMPSARPSSRVHFSSRAIYLSLSADVVPPLRRTPSGQRQDP